MNNLPAKNNNTGEVQKNPVLVAMSQIQQAVEKGLPVETLEKLLLMRTTLKHEWAKMRFFEDLTTFQSKVPEIPKDKVVFNKDKTTVRYKYASLDTIIKTIKPYLQKYGFSYRFETAFSNNAVLVSCVIQHKDGHIEKSSFRTPVDTSEYMSDIQKWGSALTYAKRYSLCLALGLTADEDTDAVQEKNGKPTIPQSSPTPQPQSQQRPHYRNQTRSEFISPAQVRRLRAILRAEGIPEEIFKKLSKIEHFSKITKIDYEFICTDLVQIVKKKLIEEQKQNECTGQGELA